MEIVILVLVAAGITAAVIYRQQIKAKIADILQKPKVEDTVKPSVSTIQPVSGPTQTELRILQAIAFLKTRVSVVSVEDVMMRLGFGLTPEEVAFAVRNGAVERQSAPVVAGVDRESFNLTAENGFLVHPKTESGKTYGFTFPKSTGLLRVLSYSGSQITKVNGEPVIGGKDFEVSSGSILLTVEFIGDRYTVQYQPR
jgi:hypothetical protein